MPEAPFAGMGLLACDRHLKSFETLFNDGLTTAWRAITPDVKQIYEYCVAAEVRRRICCCAGSCDTASPINSAE
jgi:hypothetical protein